MNLDEKSRFDILLIDDDENMIYLVSHILADPSYNIVTARNGKDALEKLINFYPDIIICDIMMPFMDGYEFRDAIREKDEYYFTSFIFMSAKTTMEDRIRGIEHGVDAYITKPFNTKEFKATVDAMIKKRIQLERLINHDALTKIFNKRKILSHLDHELLRVKRYGNMLSILILDLDYFKKINDTFGHPEGDTVLESIARVGKESLREIDFIGRIGGEEFMIVMPETDKVGAYQFSERLRIKISGLFFGMNNLKLTISGGIATAPDDSTERDDLIKKADDALYQAKRSGRNKIIFWEKETKQYEEV